MSSRPAPLFVIGTPRRTQADRLRRYCERESVFLWNEAHRRSDVVPSMAGAASTALSGYNPTGPATLRTAYRSALDALFGAPAGYARWGLLDVRVGPLEIEFLRWVYPDATFVEIDELLAVGPRLAPTPR